MSSEMIEHIAKAICAVRNDCPCACAPGPPDADVCFMDLELARAALEALREPTRMMVFGGTRTFDYDVNGAEGVARDAWRDMIAAALGEPEFR